MAGYWTDTFSYINGAIRESDIAYLIMVDNAALKMNMSFSSIVQWEPEGWGNGGQVDWRAIGAAVSQLPKRQLIVVGEYGHVKVLGGGEQYEEKIEVDGVKPQDRGPLRFARTIGNEVFVVGMDRQVYRRGADKKWVSCEAGIAKTVGVSGLESIDGVNENELYAVGWDGEIWHYQKSKWKQEDSPTKNILSSVCCAKNGEVYASGRQGLVLKREANTWRILDQEYKTEDFWSLAYFNDNLYACSLENVFQLNRDGIFFPIDINNGKALSTGKLVSGKGWLWSIGLKDVLGFDGTEWKQID